MSRRKSKGLLTFLFAVVTAVSLTACSREANGAENTPAFLDDGEEYVYVPSYREFQAEEDEFFTGFTVKDGAVYYAKTSFGADTQTTCIVKADIGTGEQEVLYEMKSEAEGESLGGFCVLENAKLAFVLSKYEAGGNRYILLVIDENGAKETEADITEAFCEGGKPAPLTGMMSDAEGNIYVKSLSKILVYDENAGFLFELETKGEQILAMGLTKEGAPVALQRSGAGIEINRIDVRKKMWGAGLAGLPDKLLEAIVAPGVRGDILLGTEEGFIECSWEEKESIQLFSWMESGINADYVVSAGTGAEDSVILVLNEWGSKTYQLCTLTKTLKSEVPECQVITLGTCIGLSQGLEEAIVNFNKNNGRYRIEVVDYLENAAAAVGADAAMYEAALRFNTDLITGNAPDLIDLSQMNFVRYMERGVLEDLTPYLEESGMSTEDFLTPVMEVYSIDGKLGAIPASVLLITMAGKKTDVGEGNGFTIDDMIALADGQPADTWILQYGTKNSVLGDCISWDEEYYIDLETGTCRFDSDEFKKVLEFANRFPEDFDYYYKEETLSKQEMVAEGKLLLMPVNIMNVWNIKEYREIYGEELRFVGYPTSDERGGSNFQGIDMLGISSGSQQKEGAWEFVQTLLTEEYQTRENFLWGIPTLKSACEKEMEALSAEEREELEQLIAGTKRAELQAADVEVYNIILEEAGAYFTGQKSAEDVAALIQNRVSLYISENM